MPASIARKARAQTTAMMIITDVLNPSSSSSSVGFVVGAAVVELGGRTMRNEVGSTRRTEPEPRVKLTLLLLTNRWRRATVELIEASEELFEGRISKETTMLPSRMAKFEIRCWLMLSREDKKGLRRAVKIVFVILPEMVVL